jgi:hypothetical protein
MRTHPVRRLHRRARIGCSAPSRRLTRSASVSAGNDTEFAIGRTVLLAGNTAASASHNVTITSAPDIQGRLGNIGPYVLAAGKVARFGPFVMESGWSTAGRLLFSADHAEVQFAVLTLPVDRSGWPTRPVERRGGNATATQRRLDWGQSRQRDGVPPWGSSVPSVDP